MACKEEGLEGKWGREEGKEGCRPEGRDVRKRQRREEGREKVYG